jgi:hypothetical protein
MDTMKGERKSIFREIYGNIPVTKKAANVLRMTLKTLTQSRSWVYRDMKTAIWMSKGKEGRSKNETMERVFKSIPTIS